MCCLTFVEGCAVQCPHFLPRINLSLELCSFWNSLSLAVECDHLTFIMAVYDVESFICEVRTAGFDRPEPLLHRAFALLKANGLERLDDIASTCFDNDWRSKEGVDAGLTGFMKQLISHQTSKFRIAHMEQSAPPSAQGSNVGNTCTQNDIAAIGKSIEDALERNKKQKRMEIHIVLAVIGLVFTVFVCATSVFGVCRRRSRN